MCATGQVSRCRCNGAIKQKRVKFMVLGWFAVMRICIFGARTPQDQVLWPLPSTPNPPERVDRWMSHVDVLVFSIFHIEFTCILVRFSMVKYCWWGRSFVRHFFGRATPGAGKQWTFGVLSPLPVSPLNSGGEQGFECGRCGVGWGKLLGVVEIFGNACANA